MKETFYFSHDYNARDDEKILNMISELWMEGYWLYWSLIETLAQNNWKMNIDSIKWLWYKLRCDNTVITQLLQDYNLFIIDEEEWVFYNKRLLTHLEKREESKQRKSEAGKKWMAKRWEKNNSVITNDNRTITNDNKVKESKVKESKVNNIITIVRETKVSSLKDLMIKNIDKDIFINNWIKEEILTQEMNKFYNYRIQKNDWWKKEHWQKQKTFDVKRRFVTWLWNIKQTNLSPKKWTWITRI